MRELLLQATKYLEDNNIPTAKTDAEILLSNLIGDERINLYLNDKIPLTKNKLERYWKLLKRRASYKPIAYILCKKEFMNWEFMVNENVLIPRPETEILVEEIINIGKKLKSPPLIVDIGTGSGVIAISLALSLNAVVYALDISSSALKIARTNAHRLKVKDKITFLKGDLLNSLKKFNLDQKVDFIISNPPYVSTSELKSLPMDVRFEPEIALDGGKDGINFYDKIINDSLNYLKEGGCLGLEVGYDQAEIISDKIRQTEKFSEIKTVKDYAQIKRVILAVKKNTPSATDGHR
ncbi:MAG: peptide chain release factor N(5)-glutamine methyltransferase [bacterium]